ncbi:MAG: HAMP domain-containing sensor histidine kinase [Pseudomonadota bacterium]
MNIFDLIEVFQNIQTPSKRTEASQTLADMLNVQQVLVFVKDVEVEVFLPAIGTNQTLPKGFLWQKFLLECERSGQASNVLPIDEGKELTALGIADIDKRCILVFVDGEPDVSALNMMKHLLPFLAGKLIDERVVITANGHAQAAREAVGKAQELNAALNRKHYELKSAIATAEREISQRIIAENKLIEADRYKNNFLATLAHELRNPLGAITLAVELQEMLNNVAPGAATQAQQTIKRQTNHLTKLVNDLLDISGVAQGKISLRFQPVRIGDVIDAALEMTRAIIDSHNHMLQVSVAEPDLILVADEARLAQIVCNLLENAAKYTPKNGKLGIDVQNDQHEVIIKVSDNGIGITEEAYEQLFTMFSQADKVEGRVSEGLGLGLSLVKKFVELHHGQISVYSEGNKLGSVFSIHLPIHHEVAEAQKS